MTEKTPLDLKKEIAELLQQTRRLVIRIEATLPYSSDERLKAILALDKLESALVKALADAREEAR